MLNEVKEILTSTAFDVARGTSAEKIHGNLLKALELISSLEKQPAQKTPRNFVNNEAEEVRKVARRLKLWANRPEQINTQILQAFLKLRREGNTTVTEQMLANSIPREISFLLNFNQMKVISPNNHGKVFEQIGNEINIWEPVKIYVDEFERTTNSNIKFYN